MNTEPDDYDPWIGREADEQTLEDARAVMRKRRPDKNHWMLLDSRADQERWDREYPRYDPNWVWGWRVRLTMVVLSAILAVFFILAVRGLVAFVKGI